jgi:Family of unknown function (DUF6644)
MNIPTFLESLESSGLASWIRESLYAFPLIESCHVIGLTMVFGTIAVVDLRLLGFAWVQRPFTRVAKDIFRWTWIAFALTVTTGLLMFITNARIYYGNAQFRAKMLFIGLSGLNMLIFELTTGRHVRRWDTNKSAPTAGRLAGALSLLLWISVIFLGRWIGFTTTANTTPTQDINLDNLFH